MTVSWPYRISGPLALSRSTHDRQSDRRGGAAWAEQVWADPATRVLVLEDGRARVDGDRLALVPPAAAPDGQRLVLGSDAEGAGYAAVVVAPGGGHGPVDAADGVVAVTRGLRELGALLDDRDAGLLVEAVALANWHATHQHCPRCGSWTDSTHGGHVRRCPRDGSEHFPRTDPAIIVAVVDEDERCLLGRQAAWPPGRFSTLAGFVEPGESLEAAVVREVHEESGVRIDEVAYGGSQPWPFPASLMCGFYARARSGHERPDGHEIAELRWYSRAELAADPRQRPARHAAVGLDRPPAHRGLVRRGPARPRVGAATPAGTDRRARRFLPSVAPGRGALGWRVTWAGSRCTAPRGAATASGSRRS